MMEVETASSITLVTISSIMEVKDWETAISGTIMSWFIYHKINIQQIHQLHRKFF